jgi:hypothetical protein
MKTFLDKNIKGMIQNICLEHHAVCKVEDSNMGYLWYMYTHGVKAGEFKPFMFLAELNLLVATGYLFEEEKERLIEMMGSSDEDNMYLVALAILQFRTTRIEQLGLYTADNPNYKEINYLTHVVSPEMFLRKVTPTTL